MATISSINQGNELLGRGNRRVFFKTDLTKNLFCDNLSFHPLDSIIEDKRSGFMSKDKKKVDIDFALKVLGGIVSLVIIIVWVGKIWSSETDLRKDVKQLKQDVQGIKQNTDGLRSDFAELKALFIELADDLDYKPKNDLPSFRSRNNKIRHLKFTMGLNVISGTYYSSPGRVFLINQFGENRSYVPFKGESTSADWSPDASEIVFQGKKFGKDNNGIYIYNINTQKIHTLTIEGNNIDPAWSPDGKEILFCSNREHPDNKNIFDLCRMNRDGSNFQVLLRNKDVNKALPNLSICLPSISPDMKYIGFSTLYKKSWDLWIMPNNDKTKIKRISRWGNCRMRFNPVDGKEIVYAVDRRNVERKFSKSTYKVYTDIIVARLDVAKLDIKGDSINNGLKSCFESSENLTEKNFASSYPNCPSDNFPDWSYDGKRIIFSTTKVKEKNPYESKWILQVFNKDGTGRKEFAGKKISGLFPNW